MAQRSTARRAPTPGTLLTANDSLLTPRASRLTQSVVLSYAMSAPRTLATLAALLPLAAALGGCSLPRVFGGGGERYDFSGTVLSMKDDFPIAGVKVTAACDNPKLDAGETTTNANGYFRLEHAFAGDIARCDLAFEHPNYKTRALRVDPRAVEKKESRRMWQVNVRLEPD